MEEYNRKAEENLMELNKSNQKKNKIITYIVVVAIILIIVSLIELFFVMIQLKKVQLETTLTQAQNTYELNIRVNDLEGSYVHSPESYSLVSLDGKDNYFVGDRLRLKLKSASRETKRIDFTVIEKLNQTEIVNSDSINNAVKIKAKLDNKGKKS